MQRLIAELSNTIEKAEFERSWHTDQDLNDAQPKVEFAFSGRRVSVMIHSGASNQWPSASFHKTFSAAIRRVDGVCNIRWL